MVYSLLVPTYRQQFNRTNPLWRYYTFDVASTLIKQDGTWTLVTTASQDQLEAAEAFYVGGYDYTISDAVAAELIADGFEDAVTPGVPDVQGLVEDFDGDELDPLVWRQIQEFPLPTVSGGQAVFTDLASTPTMGTVELVTLTGTDTSFYLDPGTADSSFFGFIVGNDIEPAFESRLGFYVQTPDSCFAYHHYEGGMPVAEPVAAQSFPCWIRLSESGGVVSFAASADGVTYDAPFFVTEEPVIDLDTPMTVAIQADFGTGSWFVDDVRIPGYGA